MSTHLGRIIQEHLDANLYQPSQRQLADRIGISPTQLGTWRKGGLRRLPDRQHLESAARVLEVPYRRVLMAALVDSGYWIEGSGVTPVDEATGVDLTPPRRPVPTPGPGRHPR